jgi:hypothetical protein
MAIIELFSKRQKKLRGDIRDIYCYDYIPEELKNQVIHIWYDAIGNEYQYTNFDTVERIYRFVESTLLREYGMLCFPSSKFKGNNALSEVRNFFLTETDSERNLDVIEVSFQIINTLTRRTDYLDRNNADKIANNAIDELNYRFREHGVGYEFINNEIVRVDSQFLHSEAVKPTLRVLNKKGYEGAEQEFLNAHEHYRVGRMKDAIDDSLKALESVLKIICNKRNWKYTEKDGASKLIDICFDNNLIPLFWQSQFRCLRNLLQDSVPTGRNKLGGHGQGGIIKDVPGYLTAYILHMTASAIVFLTEAEAAYSG